MRSSESLNDPDTKAELYHHQHIEDAAADQEITQVKRRKKWVIISAIAVAIVIIVAIIVAVVVPLSLNSRDKNFHAASSDQDEKNVFKPASLVAAPEQRYHPPAYAYDVSPYSNLIRLKTYIPASDHGRIFVMGDLHGCLSEMNQLLEKVEFQPNKDVLVLTGDLVFRGEDSVGVIRRARELNALCVRGNHDDKVVRFRTFENEHGSESMGPPSEIMPEGQVGDPLKFKNAHVEIARALDVEDYKYLAGCPLILDIPELHARVVHGGLDPSVNNVLDNDPWSVMNMRHIDGNNQPTKQKLRKDDDKDARHWTEAYAEQGSRNPTVYYGHDASLGVMLGKQTIGLDSGCVYGRQLSIMDMISQKMTQIDCVNRISSDSRHKQNDEYGSISDFD